MKKYTIKNERITLNPAYKENALPSINFKIYVLAALVTNNGG